MNIRENCLFNITRILSILKVEVEFRGSLNLYDINIHAENFYRDFFNVIFDLNLVNLNFDEKNASYIDLIDKKEKRAIQVTSQNDGGKIKHSIEGFMKKPEHSKYQLEVILIAKSAKDYTADFTIKGKFDFDHKKNVIDLERLLKIINNLKTEKLEEIFEFLSKQTNIPRPKTETNEVETIMSLIEFLSDDENTQDSNNEKPNPPDPERKFHRFEEHREFLQSHYEEMYALYFGTLQIAKEKVGLDGVRAKKITSFLKYKSDSVLNECNNNPRVAIDNLTDFFEEKLFKYGFNCDQSAIRFYLLDELIQCNVFPNPVNNENASI